MTHKGATTMKRIVRFVSFTAAAVILFAASFAFAQEAAPAAAPASAGVTVLNAFLQYVLPPLVVTLAALVGLALTRLSAYLHTKAQGSAVGQALVTGSDFVSKSVSHVISGLAPAVRDALANDGRIDSAERALLKAKAIELVKAELPDGIKTVLGGAIGGLETWLSGAAEQAITAATAQASAASPK